MKKNNILKLGLILLFVLFFNLVVFLVTKKEHHTTTFWVAYAFVMVSYGFLAFAFLIVGNPKQKVFSGLSYFALTIIYHVLALLLGIIFMFLYKMNFIAPFLIQSLLVILYIGITIIGLMGDNIVKGSLERDEKNKQFLKRLAFQVSVFEQTVSDENLKKQLNRLFESISSSPFHTEAGVEEIESRLVETIDDLKDAVEDHDYPLVEKLTEDALKVVKERNNYLKLNH
ncbi:MAG TPA: hypothetical protein GXZ35_05095 [Acholeplasmataceae bacterium]|nr:hypothetical protein [Acholeplasmataceae bacterium]